MMAWGGICWLERRLRRTARLAAALLVLAGLPIGVDLRLPGHGDAALTAPRAHLESAIETRHPAAVKSDPRKVRAAPLLPASDDSPAALAAITDLVAAPAPAAPARPRSAALPDVLSRLPDATGPPRA